MKNPWIRGMPFSTSQYHSIIPWNPIRSSRSNSILVAVKNYHELSHSIPMNSPFLVANLNYKPQGKRGTSPSCPGWVAAAPHGSWCQPRPQASLSRGPAGKVLPSDHGIHPGSYLNGVASWYLPDGIHSKMIGVCQLEHLIHSDTSIWHSLKNGTA